MSKEQLIVELRGEVFKFEDFELTFGDILAAKQKARLSSNGGKYAEQHEMLWLTQKIFEKNDYDKDISWLKDVPIKEMQYLMSKIDGANPQAED